MPKQLEGTIISDKMQQAVVVRVERTYRHPRYHKIIRLHKNYKASIENQELAIGDFVRIEETRPQSKTIHFKVVEKLNK